SVGPDQWDRDSRKPEIKLHAAADEEGAREELAVLAVSHRHIERRQSKKDDSGREISNHCTDLLALPRVRPKPSSAPRSSRKRGPRATEEPETRPRHQPSLSPPRRSWDPPESWWSRVTDGMPPAR